MEAARREGNLTIFGTPLMLCTMPDDFNFDEAPEFKFKVWAALPGLQLELWQPSTLAKIVSMVGTPIEVDHRTVARVNIDGPRIYVMVDPKTPPPGLNTGAGRMPSRPPQQGGQRGASRPRQTGGGSRHRSVSRPPPGHAKAGGETLTPSTNIGGGENQVGPATGHLWGAIPKSITNNHIHIPSPSPGPVTHKPQFDPMIEEGLFSTLPLPMRHQLLEHLESAKEDGVEAEVEDNVLGQIPCPSINKLSTEEVRAGSEGEETVYESDDQASANQSLAAESLHEERIGEDLEEPNTMVGVNREQVARDIGNKLSEGGIDAVISPNESPTVSKDSSWGPEKEVTYGNNTRCNKGKKVRAGTATRRSNRNQ